MPLQIATASFAVLFTMLLLLSSERFVGSRVSSLNPMPAHHGLR